MIRHGPAYDPTAEGIHDDGEEDKAGPRRNVGDIGNPETVKLGDIELPLDEVRSGARVGIAGGRSGAPAPVDALEGGLAHQSSDTLATHSDALLGELEVDARRTVGASRLRVMTRILSARAASDRARAEGSRSRHA